MSVPPTRERCAIAVLFLCCLASLARGQPDAEFPAATLRRLPPNQYVAIPTEVTASMRERRTPLFVRVQAQRPTSIATYVFDSDFREQKATDAMEMKANEQRSQSLGTWNELAARPGLHYVVVASTQKGPIADSVPVIRLSPYDDGDKRSILRSVAVDPESPKAGRQFVIGFEVQELADVTCYAKKPASNDRVQIHKEEKCQPGKGHTHKWPAMDVNSKEHRVILVTASPKRNEDLRETESRTVLKE